MKGGCPACGTRAGARWPHHTAEQLREYHPVRAEYEDATRELRFAKDFSDSLQAMVYDPSASVGERFLAWIKLRAWGNYSLYCVDAPDGEPAYQADFVAELAGACIEIDRRRVSEAARDLEARGYIRMAGPAKLLYPVLSPPRPNAPPDLGGVPHSSDKFTNAPEGVPHSQDKFTNAYQAFRDSWKTSHPDQVAALEDARAIVKRIERAMLGDYKAWKKSGECGAPAAAETPAETPDSPVAPIPTPRTNQPHIKEESLRVVPSVVETTDGRLARIEQHLGWIAEAFPHSDYTRRLNNPDRIAPLIDEGLAGNSVDKFFGWVGAEKFSERTGRGEQPGRPHGPRGPGLIIAWAWEFSGRRMPARKQPASEVDDASANARNG